MQSKSNPTTRKEKRKLKKKLKRSIKRKMIALEHLEREQRELEQFKSIVEQLPTDLDSQENVNNDKPSQNVNTDKPTQKRFFGPEKPTFLEQKKQENVQSKQHRGLRCKKCFLLLCRDSDFDFINGQIWIDPSSLQQNWDGLVLKEDAVYCQNMHYIGNVTQVAKKTTIIITTDKTTFKENFLLKFELINKLIANKFSPEYADSDKIKNKIRLGSGRVVVI